VIDTCLWCNTGEPPIPIQQGGSVHMGCEECGSGRGIITMEEFREMYFDLLCEVKELRRKVNENI